MKPRTLLYRLPATLLTLAFVAMAGAAPASAFCQTVSKTVSGKSQDAALAIASQTVEARIAAFKRRYGAKMIPEGASGGCTGGPKIYRCTYSRRFCVNLF